MSEVAVTVVGERAEVLVWVERVSMDASSACMQYDEAHMM